VYLLMSSAHITCCGGCCTVWSLSCILLLVSLRCVASDHSRAIGVDASEAEVAKSNLSTAIYLYTGCLGLSLICICWGRVKRQSTFADRLDGYENGGVLRRILPKREVRWNLGEDTPLLSYERNVEMKTAA